MTVDLIVSTSFPDFYFTIHTRLVLSSTSAKETMNNNNIPTESWLIREEEFRKTTVR